MGAIEARAHSVTEKPVTQPQRNLHRVGEGELLRDRRGLIPPQTSSPERTPQRSNTEPIRVDVDPKEVDRILNIRNQKWMDDALCKEDNPEKFFPEKGSPSKTTKEVCAGCSVREQCLDYALTNGERFGMWGGLSERELRRRQGKPPRKLKEDSVRAIRRKRQELAAKPRTTLKSHSEMPGTAIISPNDGIPTEIIGEGRRFRRPDLAPATTITSFYRRELPVPAAERTQPAQPEQSVVEHQKGKSSKSRGPLPQATKDKISLSKKTSLVSLDQLRRLNEGKRGKPRAAETKAKDAATRQQQEEERRARFVITPPEQTTIPAPRVNPETHQLLQAAKDSAVLMRISERDRQILDKFFYADISLQQLSQEAGYRNQYRFSQHIQLSLQRLWEQLPDEVRQQLSHDKAVQLKSRKGTKMPPRSEIYKQHWARSREKTRTERILAEAAQQVTATSELVQPNPVDSGTVVFLRTKQSA